LSEKSSLIACATLKTTWPVGNA